MDKAKEKEGEGCDFSLTCNIYFQFPTLVPLLGHALVGELSSLINTVELQCYLGCCGQNYFEGQKSVEEMILIK